MYIYIYTYAYIYIYVFFPPGTKEQFAAALQGSSNSGKSKRSAIVRSPHPVSCQTPFEPCVCMSKENVLAMLQPDR